MNIQKLVRIVTVAGSAMFALAGCAVDAETKPAPEETPPAVAAEENTATTAEALRAGGGGGRGFNCGGLGCICNGDWDCNNMFGSGACGSWPAKCYERGPGPVYCICAPWVGRSTVMTSTGAAAPSGGVLAPR